jgi:hypothetical protein
VQLVVWIIRGFAVAPAMNRIIAVLNGAEILSRQKLGLRLTDSLTATIKKARGSSRDLRVLE